jgi:hypothetical protein
MIEARVMVFLGVLVVAGCADPVVGASCRVGFHPESGRCVPSGEVAGGDAGMPWAPDAEPDGGAVSADADPSGSSCDLGEIRCGDRCARPDRDRDHCGGCGASCAAGAVCAAGECTDACDEPLVWCEGACVDVTGTDPDHCGACGRGCPSGLCVAGECRDATAGHVVLVGHDFTVSRTGMARIAGNAVFLASGAPVEVLAFEGSALERSIRGIDRAVDQVAASSGRSWIKSEAVEAQLLVQLEHADVLLVYPQRSGSDRGLTALGIEWSRGLASFLRRGGVVVVFDGPSPDHRGTFQVLEGASLIDVDRQTVVTGDPLSLEAPADAVGLRVPLTYLAEESTVSFATDEPAAVVAHDTGPVVVHRVVTP